jgi:integrase
VLIVMLKDAGRDGLRVPGNVLTVKRPGTPESERDALPIEHATQVLNVAGGDPSGSRWVAAFLQGMRSGECRGLTWDRVDFHRRLVDVSWQLQELPYDDREAGTFRVPDGYTSRQLVGRMHLVRPKTTKSRRVIPLVPWMYDALKAWREVAPANPYGLVWTSNGRPISKHDDLDAWHDLQDRAGVQYAADDGSVRKYTLHEARHTTATLLLKAGVDAHVVTAILGHSKITTSRGYQHVSLDMERAALEQVAAMLQLGRE